MRPRFGLVFTLLQKKGAGKAGRRLHPRSCAQSARVDHRATDHPAFPAQWCYGLLRDLPGEPSSVATVAREKPHELGASLGRQVHTTSPSAPISAERSTGTRGPAKFWRKQLAAPFVARRSIAHGRTRPAIPCAPDAVASIASHRAFVTTRDPPLLG